MPDDATKRTINLLRIDIKSDGTFEMMESGITSSGVTKLGSEQAFLTVRERLGQSLSRSGSGPQSRDQDLVLEWGEDGRVFYRDHGAYGGTKVEVKKVSGD